MHYVILRDDDTCALTPVECLETLYRPFLDRGLPVNLAVIPNVGIAARRPNGQREGFLQFGAGSSTPFVPIGQNRALVDYLLREPLYHILHHGYDHSLYEFQCDAAQAEHRLAAGAQRLQAAGFPTPHAFVAPYDRFSAAALRQAAARYPVISSGWYEWRRLPPAWWPAYLLKKLRRAPHWRVHDTLLLSHPGCLLSRHRPLAGMFENLRLLVETQPLTVLVTHWWEYFQETRPDRAFIEVLHRTADYLARSPEVRVIAFADLATGRVTLPGLASTPPEPARQKPFGTGPRPARRPACLSDIDRSISPAP
ncbi:MAG TPA: DUF2334 domain-containing protein [Lacunisphaera sp.]|nr:DUF2334 domain-containing protein [Lacunisphaera sp.]